MITPFDFYHPTNMNAADWFDQQTFQIFYFTELDEQLAL